jgi:hypothetical protein
MGNASILLRSILSGAQTSPQISFMNHEQTFVQSEIKRATAGTSRKDSLECRVLLPIALNVGAIVECPQPSTPTP